MPQVPIQTGVRVVEGAFRASYPVNLQHKVLENGVSQGQLVNTRGAVAVSQGPGVDCGGLLFGAVMYRGMGGKLVRVGEDGAIVPLGTIGDVEGVCRFAQSFDRIAVATNDRLYLSDGGDPVQVTDPDLGRVLDVTWIDSYFATTDGESVVVTELNDPTSIDPLKYGSAESDPDPVTGVEAYNEELLVFGRYTIQAFQNVGGNGFPFRAIKGATIGYGCVAAAAKVQIAGTIAFAGGARDEPIGIYLMGQGSALRISDETLDEALNALPDPSLVRLEQRTFAEEVQLLAHLEGETWAITLRASEKAETQLWHVERSAGGQYRPRNAVWAYGRHWVGDTKSATLGTLAEGVSAHYGVEPGWLFEAGLLFNEGMGAIIHEIALTGHFPRTESVIFFSMTRDGEVWSNEAARRLTGRRSERPIWRPNVHMRDVMGLRFRGRGLVAVARADAQAEPLAA